MKLPITENEFKSINEIWDDGPNSIQVVTANHRTIRITARGNVRSGAVPKYVAHYEEQVEIEPRSGQRIWVWAAVDFPWQDGADVQQCLLLALRWVDEHS